jgi:hypothetical protein
MIRIIISYFTFFILFSNLIFGQNTITIKGIIRDQENLPISNVNITQKNTSNTTTTDENGEYSLRLDFDDNFCEVEFKHIQFKTQTIKILSSNKIKKELNVVMESDINEIDSIEIVSKNNSSTDQKLQAKSAEYFPNPTNDIGTIVKTFAGVQSNNELTGQYNVRGGNYDENLTYVNDFEIYRTFLTSSGQQEGLSFANTDLVESLSFSAGGFESKYNDKMSSVLNVKYKSPDKFRGSIMASLLGVNAHVEGSTKNKKFTYLTGIRYKTNAYLLGSLDAKGEYNPNFFDIQGDFHYKPNNKHDIEILAYHAFNKYKFTPELQETRAGTFDQLIRFLVDFEGGENSQFKNSMAGIAYKFIPNNVFSLKINSAFWKMQELEQFNITGYYSLDEIEIDQTKDNFGNVKNNLGSGTFHDWARNRLDATVFNTAINAKVSLKNHLLEFGNTIQYEHINDKMSEWTRVDSAGFAVPYSGNFVSIQDRLKSSIDIASIRTHGYFQDKWTIRNDSVKFNIIAGVRYHFWNVNKEILVSPRVQFIYQPKLKADVTFRAALGLYQQAPFYREMRNFDGSINKNIKAQKSAQIVIGADYNFRAWGKRNFKLTTEAYYKYLWQLNPYEIEDIRIRYFAKNNATGYATGIDLRLFGELVKGTDSWISISYLSTKENLTDDFYYKINENAGVLDTQIVYPGKIRRPTDQTLFFNLYFQDYLVKNKSFKVHFNLIVGTGLPFGPPDRQRYKDVLKIPPYRRLDIGFSYLIIDGIKRESKKPKSFGAKFDKIWTSFEVFNILGIYNTLSYRWVKDIDNNQWAIPNYLTNRRFNLKLHISW